MPSSAALRLQIERSLEHRFPSVLTPAPRTIREVATTGVPEIDELLNGGLPVGTISEITGNASSGRTSIAVAFLAQRTRDGNVCAWVDASDAFDPESAAANGVCLKQLLWVRCRNATADQCSETTQKFSSGKDKPWMQLDQALRATDLLLQAGGFAAIVLDLGDSAVEHANRIPRQQVDPCSAGSPIWWSVVANASRPLPASHASHLHQHGRRAPRGRLRKVYEGRVHN